MTLTVDVGNSHTVVGLWKGGALAETLRLSTEARRTADEWRILLSTWLKGAGVEGKISRAAFCSVVPAASSALSHAVTAMGVKTPLWLSSEINLNFTFNYP